MTNRAKPNSHSAIVRQTVQATRVKARSLLTQVRLERHSQNTEHNAQSMHNIMNEFTPINRAFPLSQISYNIYPDV